MSTPLRHFHLLYRAKQQLYPISHHSLSSNLITSHNISFIISLSSLIPSLLSHYTTSQLCHHISFNTSLISTLVTSLTSDLTLHLFHDMSFITPHIKSLSSHPTPQLSLITSLQPHLTHSPQISPHISRSTEMQHREPYEVILACGHAIF